MFRRRRFPPPLPAQRVRRAIQSTEIAEAHALLEQGRPLDAAVRFENLALEAAARGGPRAPQFYLQAGRAFFAAHAPDRGMVCLEKAHDLGKWTPRQNAMGAAFARVSAELQSLGYPAEAARVASWGSAQSQPSPVTASLPTRCPSCGGPLLPDELDWLDPATAECPYCGNPVRAIV